MIISYILGLFHNQMSGTQCRMEKVMVILKDVEVAMAHSVG
jgi:hypothetical protein